MRIELFSCSGGMALGFERAGLPFEWSFDFSPEACDSFEANLGRRPICIDVRDLQRLLLKVLRPAVAVDLLVADPPCTPYSRAGKRLGPADPRDMLRVTVDLIDLLRPERFLIGNVPGLSDANNWQNVVQPVIGGLSRIDYCIEYASLDAADYGVPQHRIRPFWFGHLTPPCIVWPEPTHRDPKRSAFAFDGRKPWVTCREALGHLPLEALGREVGIRRRDPKHPVAEADEPAQTICGTRGGGGAQGGLACIVTATRQDDGQMIYWPWDRPATTVQCNPRLAPFGHHDKSARSDPHAVILSELALTILQGFPENWQWCSPTKTGRQSMRGQAMPPPLAEAVARSIRAQMEHSM